MKVDTSQVLNVFLGSPGDLGPEREIVEKAINRLNKKYGRAHKIRIDLSKWEDMTSGKGRPQGRINEVLKQTDLFIGLIWKKWGTPTGEYTSGFEEEFVIASTQENIEMWMFFKNIPEEDLANLSEDIEKVQKFKQKVIETKNLTFKPFNTEEWETIIYDDLIQYCGELLSKRTSSESTLPLHLGTPNLPEMVKPKRKKKQKINVLNSLLSVVSKSNQENIDLNTRLRLFSLSTSLLYNTDIRTEYFANHEIHLLYKHLHPIELTPTELYLIFKTVIEDDSSLKCGWIWLKNYLSLPLNDLLLFLAKDASSEGLRAKAIYLLEKSCSSIDLKRISSFLDLEEEKVISTILVIFGRLGALDEIVILDKMIKGESGSISKIAWLAKTEILLRIDPLQALNHIVESSINEQGEFLPVLKKIFEIYSPQELIYAKKLLTHWSEEVKFRVVQKLASILTDDELKMLAADKAASIRGLALKEMIRRDYPIKLADISSAFKNKPKRGLLSSIWSLVDYGEDVTEEEVFKYFFARYSEDELRKAINWLGTGKEVAYQVLVEKFFIKDKEVIESDLKTGFSRIKSNYIEESKALYSTKEELAKLDELDSYIKSKFLVRLVKGLEAVTEPEVLKLARIALELDHGYDRSEILSSILNIFDNFGEDQDVEKIKSHFDDFKSDDKVKAVSVLLKLSRNNLDVVKFLLAKEEDRITRAVFLQALHNKKLISLKTAKEYLFHKRDSIRLAALAHISETWGPSQLKNILPEVLSNDSYFYNVVCYMDRLLYAHKSLKSVYKQDLLETLKTST